MSNLTVCGFIPILLAAFNAAAGNPVDFGVATGDRSDALIRLQDAADTALDFDTAAALIKSKAKADSIAAASDFSPDADPLPLEYELVVTAARFPQLKKEVPNRVIQVAREDVAFQNPQTGADLIAGSGGVFVQKSQLGGGSPMLNGFSANRVLLMIDGVRMNNAIYRSGNLQNVISIDPNTVDKVDIIFGPGSIVYGSDAIGGVMAFSTLRPKLSSGDTTRLSGAVLGRIATADREKTGHADISIGARTFASVTSLTLTDFDDLRMGSHRHDEYQRLEYVTRKNGIDSAVANEDPDVQAGSGYGQINLMQKLRFQSTADLSLENGFHYSATSDIPRYDRLIQYRRGTLRYGDWYYGPQKWLMNALSLFWTRRCSLFDEMKWIAAYQDYEESRYSRAFRDSIRLEQAERVTIGSLSGDFFKTFTKNSSLYYGVEAVYNDVTSTGANRHVVTNETEKAASRYPNSDYLTAAGYATFKQRLSAIWLAHAGARYSYIGANGTFDTTLLHLPYDAIELATSAVNASAGLVCTHGSATTITATLSSGFRAPNIDDMGKLFDPAPGTVIVPNSSLEPEYVYNADLGISQALGRLVSAEAGGFYMHLDNAMVRRPSTFTGRDSILYNGDLSQVVTIVNADRAYAFGANGTLTVRPFRYLSLKGQVTYTKGEEQDETTGEYFPLRHAAPLMASGHLTYQNDRLRIELYGIHNSSIPYDELAPSERDKPYLYAADGDGNPYCPEWNSANLKIGFQMTKNLHLSGGVENILDLRYRPYSSGIVAPGRNAIVALRASF
ncbi:MAG: TonB-dependent receptor [Chitinispirillaceae bacterium]|nr:TonB-dependent receptor [Chitinispirillaceae bacterium]